MLYRKLLLTFSLLTIALASMAKDFPVRYLGIEQGLSNNAVTAIFQDHRGFMWVGTYDGLNRYDGYSFKIFKNIIGDSTSLSTNVISSIAEDGRRNIWIGTENGVNIFDPVSETFYSPKYKTYTTGQLQNIKGEIPVIKNINDQTLLIGTRRNGLIVFENNATEGIQIPIETASGKLTSYHIHTIEFDEKRNIAWVFIEDHGLFVYNVKKKILEKITDAVLQAFALKTDNQGNVWMGTESDLVYYNVQAKTCSRNYMPAKSTVVCLWTDKQGTLWIGCDGSGIFQLKPGDTRAVPLSTPTINSNAVYSIYGDNDGRKWIGTIRGGLNVIEPHPLFFQQVYYYGKKQNEQIDNFILSFCEDQRHNVMIGTDGAGLRYWDRQRNAYTEYRHDGKDPSSISSNFITGITMDSQDDMWISTWFGGICRLKKNSRVFEKFTLYNTKTKSYESNAWLVYQDAQKNIWTSATNDGSLYRFNRTTNAFEIFDPAIMNLQSFTEDSNGQLWGGNYTSLIRINKNKQHQIYNIGHAVRYIYEDSKRRFWLGTQDAGLLLFDRNAGTYKQFTTADGLPSNTILRLLEDKQGNLWLSSYNGLAKFNPATRTCHNFTKSDGLQSNQFSFNAAIALSDGQFLFGGIKGFNMFSPDSIYEQQPNPGIFLTGLIINNKTIDKNSHDITERDNELIRHITLPYDRSTLSLDFVALDYSGTDKIKYAYLLQGWDKTWTYPKGSRTANYSRLQEGTYTFKIKTSAQGSEWGNETQVLQITILPPWYRTWWAYLAYVITAISLVYGYIRYTRKQERLKYEIKLAHLENEKDKELTEKKLSFFTYISHEFRTPLSLIIDPLKEITQNKDNSYPEDLNIAYRNSKRLLSLVDQLLLFRKADSGADILKVSSLNIAELCNEVYQCFVQQARARHIRYEFSVASTIENIYADHEKIEIALFNLLSNAFKFTPNGGSISFEVHQTSTTISIAVHDSGCGISADECDKIFDKFQQATKSRTQKAGFGIGLYLVKHFVEGHNGSVTVKSELKKGTSFSIVLLKGKAHFPADIIIEEGESKHELLEELAVEPHQQAETQATIDIENSEEMAAEVVTDKKTILVVDDNAEIREYLCHIFKNKYYLYSASDGISGLEKAKTYLPDLIISDINMDGIDGVELCYKVKQSDSLGHIPVILLTASSSEETKLKGIEGGADDYVTKPFDSKLLMAKVETILKNRNLLQKFFLDSITLQESTIKVPAEYRDFLKKCIKVVEDNLDVEDFNIQKFAKAMGMSRSSLYEKVKHVSGQSLNAFVRSIRLRRAALLMIRENMNVNQAAFQVGITDVRYFREKFTSLFGMVPSDYIKKYRTTFTGDLNVIRKKSD